MSASAAPAGTDTAIPRRFVPSLEEGAEFGLEGDMGRIEHLPARDDDDVDAPRGFVVAKQLASEAFGPVSHHRRPQFAGSRDAETSRSGRVGPDEQGHQAAGHAPPVLVEPLELLPRTDVLVRAEPGHPLPFV